eukprot:13681114-Ditylum_brightwellii.AAC.1
MLFHGVDDSVDDGGSHLTHLTQVVDFHLKTRMEQNACGLNMTESRNVLYDNVKSTDAKEDDDGVDGCGDNCFDGCVDNCFDGCDDDCFDGCVDGHVDCCVDVGKEDGVDDSVD